ncbi:uncharacterized protein TNIN_488991 [Trichonephila inaurata madagascariensis]|uniref:Uncharacterized protein n=1 Tax=Trichonephila inaurata madagascariensis TaxID=2747483 RepID=A0A8X7CQC1_9ARAC|nr:uncharacterized protein TNIN_488991 [Trichonephila inaurata madagascariensis]
MQFRKKNIRILVLFLYSDNGSANIARNKSWEYLLVFLVLNFTSPLLLAVLYVYLTRDEEGITEFWTLGYEFQEKRFGMIINFIGEYSYFAVYVEYPCLCTLSACVLVHRYGLLLFQFDEGLRKMELSMFSTKCFRVVNRYTEIEKKILLLKDTLSAPMFIMLLGSFFNIYTALSNTLQEEVPSYYWIELGRAYALPLFSHFSVFQDGDCINRNRLCSTFEKYASVTNIQLEFRQEYPNVEFLTDLRAL